MNVDDFRKVWLTKTPDGLMLDATDPNTTKWREYGTDYMHLEPATPGNTALPMVSEECRVVPVSVLAGLLLPGEENEPEYH